MEGSHHRLGEGEVMSDNLSRDQIELMNTIIDMMEAYNLSPDDGLEVLNVVVASACCAKEEHFGDGKEAVSLFNEALLNKYETMTAGEWTLPEQSR